MTNDIKKQPNGCIGKCCTEFTLYGDSKEDYIAEGKLGIRDSAFVGNMLKFIGYDNEEKGWPVYTCKYWDSDTGKCRVYSIRPKLCRDYPNGEVCQWEGCSYDPSLDPEAYIPEEKCSDCGEYHPTEGG